MSLEIKVKFCLTGLTLPPDEITTLLEIEPTQTWCIGDFVQGTALKRKHNGWCLATQLSNDIDLGKHVKSLLDSLPPKATIVREICTKYNLDAEISCSVYLEGTSPIINFNPKILAKISDLGATLDVDIIEG